MILGIYEMVTEHLQPFDFKKLYKKTLTLGERNLPFPSFNKMDVRYVDPVQ